eukprot:scaffold246622_cov41-Prasinocladus_malaysianus.AAC.1
MVKITPQAIAMMAIIVMFRLNVSAALRGPDPRLPLCSMPNSLPRSSREAPPGDRHSGLGLHVSGPAVEARALSGRGWLSCDGLTK